MIATRPVREGTSMSCSITNAETCTLPSQQPKVHIDNLDLLRTSAPSIARAKKAAAKSPRSRTITVPSDSVSSPRAAHDDQPKKKKSSSDLSRTPATAMTRQSISTRMSSC
uniref:Uncharacterized protein n=1 Tax=Grammatophora oceanica TaxID=210454 RepID=A0A7S1YGG9_9STRA